MAKESANNYEETRKQRLEDNKKRFEELGLLKIAKSLSDLKNTEKKTVIRHPKPKSESVYLLEPRRSSRARNPVSTYQDEVEIEPRHFRKRSKLSSSWASYLARPLHEVKTATFKQRAQAMKCAEKFQSNLTSGNPSFVKSMVRSHVYSCFWLGLPRSFCGKHLPKGTEDVVLEAENGAEYDAVYIGKRTGLSGGWRAFALDFKLDDGDAVVFELIQPLRFKVYVIRASSCSTADNVKNTSDGEEESAENDETEPEQEIKKSKKKVTRTLKKKESTEMDEEEEEEPEQVTKNSKEDIARPLRASTRKRK